MLKPGHERSKDKSIANNRYAGAGATPLRSE
jgi:hypothetical protein